MVELIVKNIMYLILIAIVWIVISKVINWAMFRGKMRMEQTKFLKHKSIKKAMFGLGFLVVMSTIGSLASLQENFHFIDIGSKDNGLSLVIAVLTVYGILYAFIQFTIGYADQKQNDKYWGKSTIEVLLTRNVEFAIFHSRFFKVLLLYSAVFPLVNRQVLHLNESYESFTLALWEVCITIVYVLYIFLFTKSLFIMKRFFSMQKNPDYSTKRLIEKEKLEEYEGLFNYSYQEKNDLFMEVLFKDTMSIEDSERKELFMKVLKGTLSSFSDMQTEKIRRQKSKKTKYEHYNLYRMFLHLYKDENLKKLGLSFDELLSMYRLTEKVLFNEVKLAVNGDQSKIITELVKLYAKSGYGYFKECTYYTVPHIIWDHVQSNADLLALHRYVETKSAWIINHQALENEAESHLKLMVQSEDNYIWKLLERSKEYIRIVEGRTSRFVFNEHSDESVKNKIYEYILSLEFKEENKVYIEVLMDALDYKYRVSLVFYILLYPHPTAFIERQQDVLFFRRLLNNWNVDQQMSDPEVKEFVLWKIETSGIERRIRPELLEWIFANLETNSTDVRLIQSCIDLPYFSYAKLLKFKYIFNENHDSYPDFFKLEHATIKQLPMKDWRVEFLWEMLRAPSLLKELFFRQHIIKLSEQVRKTSTPVDYYGEDDFRLFYINPFFEMTEIQFWKLLQERGYLRKGIFEFLILKLDEAAYDYLFTNDRLSEVFKRRVTEIIYKANLGIESYVNLLVERANKVYINSPVSQLKKDKIVRKLIDLLYE